MTNYFIKIPFHPLYIATLSLSLGIIFQNYFLSLYLSFFIFLFLSSTSFILFFLKKINYKKLINSILIFSCFYFGSLRYNQSTEEYKNLINSLNNQKISINGWISNLSKNSKNGFNKSITLEITSISICYKNKIKKIFNNYGTLKIFTIWDHELKVGDEILIENLYFKKNNNEEFEKYLIKENILNFLFIPKLEFKKEHSKNFYFSKKIAQIREKIFSNLSKKMHRNTFNLFCSIFLGFKDASSNLTQKTEKEFATWGLVHYLVRGGLHVAFIIFIWNMIFRYLPLYYFLKQLIMILFIIFYNLLTWQSISFLRAFFVFLIYRASNIKNLSINPLYVLILTCFIILLNNPLQLFFLDFQLSFGLTLFLLWFNAINSKIKFIQLKTIDRPS